MSLTMDCGTHPKGLITAARDGFVYIGEYEISNQDFCALVEYFMANTDMLPSDPRYSLLAYFGGIKLIPGFNRGRRCSGIRQSGEVDE